MRIGPTEMFSSVKAEKSCVVTKFFFIGLPLFPLESYFVYNHVMELGSCRIPLHKRNVFKNYMVFFFGLFSLNQFLAVVLSVDLFTITYDLNPYYFEMIKAGIPLHLIEYFITVATLILTLYFAFRFDAADSDEIEERRIFMKCDFAIRPLPHEGFVALAYRYLKPESLATISRQLKHLLFTAMQEMPAEQKALFADETLELWAELLNAKWSGFMQQKTYRGATEETQALCFIILSIEQKMFGENFSYKSQLDEIKTMFR